MQQLAENYSKKKDNESLTHSPYGKVPPNAVDLERIVLGAILLEKDAYDNVSDVLKPECFYSEIHKTIFQAIQDLALKNQPIDSQNLFHELKQMEKLEYIGGPYVIAKLTEDVFSAANIVSHARIIFQQFLKRELIRISSEIIGLGYDETTDAFELLDLAENNISDVGVKNISGGMISIGKVAMEAIKKIEEWRNQEGELTGVPSGFEKLDKATRGFQGGDLIILGARPSVGKTAFALNLVRNAALKIPVAVFSLEMRALQLVLRVLSAESKIWLHKIQTGNISDAEMKNLIHIVSKVLMNLKIFFDEKTGLTIPSLKRKLKRLVKTEGLGLVVIDYIQLMSGENHMSREQQVATISRELKKIALELNIPIIGLSQLSRENGSKGITWDNGPGLGSLRESGALEQDADVVMMLWGPSEEEIAKDHSLIGKRKLRIAKQRNGNLMTEEFNFANEIQLFEKIQNIAQPGLNFKPVNYSEPKYDEDAPF